MAFASQQARKLAQTVGCPHEISDVNGTMNCLIGLDASVISSFKSSEHLIFPPVIDGSFLPASPFDLLQTGDFYKTQILAGVNSNEGSLFLMGFLPDIFSSSEEVSLNRSEFIRSVIRLNPTLNRVQQEALVFQYTDWSAPDSPRELITGLDQLLGDRRYACPMSEWTRAYAADRDPDTSAYVYELSHRSSQSSHPAWAGVAHTDDIWFVFGHPLLPGTGYTERERDLARAIITYWTNFADTGNPNYGGGGGVEARWTPVAWEPVSSSGHDYLILTATGAGTRMSRGTRVRAAYCATWNQYLPTLANMSTCNEDACEESHHSGTSHMVKALALPCTVGLLFVVLTLWHHTDNHC